MTETPTPEEMRRGADAHLMHSVQRLHRGRRVVIERARGSRVWDIDGREYLDAVSGTNGTALVGHNNPSVREAVVAQLDTLVNNFYVYDNPPAIELAGRLAEVTPGSLGKAFFCLGGGEAI
jgi:PLP-dependent transaminase